MKMEGAIGTLLTDYEHGHLTRRELIGSLLVLAGSGRTASSAAALKGIRIDHVSLQVADLKRSQDFYSTVFNGTVEPRPNGSVRVNVAESGYFVLRTGNPAGQVDHVAVSLIGFNKDSVVQQLREFRIVPVDDTGGMTGADFHVVDPDGLRIQLK